MSAPGTDPAALYDALNCLSMSVLLLEDGTGDRAVRGRDALMTASVAAAGAFPEGTKESAALNVLLGVVTQMAEAGTVDASPP